MFHLTDASLAVSQANLSDREVCVKHNAPFWVL